MRVWVAGQLALAADAILVAAAGLAGSPVVSDPRPRVLLLLGAVGFFFLPSEIALRVPVARTRPWFWMAASVPAVLWVPVAPAIFLAAGPPLASQTGLALAALGLIGAVIVIVTGSLAALEARSRTPDG